MSEQRFLSVEISKYALMNPDHSSKSVPINAHFEIIIRKAADSTDGGEVPEEGKERKERNEEAKPAPTVVLSDLVNGEYPLFANGSEVDDFVNSMIVDSSMWTKSYAPDSDSIKFVYSGGAKTLEPDFVLRVCSDGFNSTAQYKGKSVIQVSSSNFSQQFEDAFDDSYKIFTEQMYVPKITAFAPGNLRPVEGEASEYEADLGDKVLLTWTIRGDYLKSPVLTENGGLPETVSPDTPVERVIVSPTVFGLEVESNVIAGLCDSRKASVGISTPPAVELFQCETYFCLPEKEVELKFAVSHAVSAFISADCSEEADREVSAPKGTVTVKPKLQDESRRLVTYTLTARGFLKKSAATAAKSASVFVSRWKKEDIKPSSIPDHTQKDGIVRVFSYRNICYCFCGQAIWKSTDGYAWEKVSQLPIPKEAAACKAAVGIYGGDIYVAGAAKDQALYFTKYDLGKGQWSDSRFFGLRLERAGGAFTFAAEEQMYYFCPEGKKIGCYNYTPEPFDCWGIVGYLSLSAEALDVDSLLYKDKLYIGAACEDGKIYVYYVSKDLKDTGSPVCLKAASAWVRLMEINGRSYAAAETGLYDIETGEQTDMMFEANPRIFGAVGNGLSGIGTDGNGWSFKCEK